MKGPPLSPPQAKAGPLSRSRGMISACWLGTDALSPQLYSSPTCLLTQHPFTPPALASHPQGPKPLTHLFLLSWPEQVAVTQGLQAYQLLSPSPPWPLLVCLCVWPANREARSCSLVLGAVASDISKVFWPRLTSSWGFQGRQEGLPSCPSSFLSLYLPLAFCSNLEGGSLRDSRQA